MIHSKGRKPKIRKAKKQPVADLHGLSWRELQQVARVAGVLRFGMKRADIEAAVIEAAQ